MVGTVVVTSIEVVTDTVVGTVVVTTLIGVEDEDVVDDEEKISGEVVTPVENTEEDDEGLLIDVEEVVEVEMDPLPLAKGSAVTVKTAGVTGCS